MTSECSVLSAIFLYVTFREHKISRGWMNVRGRECPRASNSCFLDMTWLLDSRIHEQQQWLRDMQQMRSIDIPAQMWEVLMKSHPSVSSYWKWWLRGEESASRVWSLEDGPHSQAHVIITYWTHWVRKNRHEGGSGHVEGLPEGLGRGVRGGDDYDIVYMKKITIV